MSTQATGNSLEERLAALERRHRRLVAFVWLSVLLAAGLWVAKMPGWLFDPVLTASRLDVKGIGGHLFVKLDDTSGQFVGGVKNDYGRLTMFRLDNGQKHRVDLVLDDDGFLVVLFNESNRPSARWAVTQDGARFEMVKGE